jgi:hypothetical protein
MVNAAGVLLDSSLVLSPGDVGFGSQTSGDKSAAKTVTLTNQGTTTYTLGTLSQVGTDYTDFTYTDNCSTTVAAGKTCTFTNYFTPTACESANAQLLITNGTSAVGYQETGTGNIPIMLTPRDIQFNTYTLIGTTSAVKDTTFTNQSGVDIIFSSIIQTGANSNEFNLVPPTSGTNCQTLPNMTLAPGASCQTGISFTPTQYGDASTTEIYYGNNCSSPQGALVQAEGTAVKVTPTTLDFPSTAVGSTGTAVVTFQNAGSSAMPISSAVPNGTSAVFSIQSNTCGFVQGTGGSVPANSSCTFTLGFTPTAAGTVTGTFTIGDPDPTGPQVVNLSGTGTT